MKVWSLLAICILGSCQFFQPAQGTKPAQAPALPPLPNDQGEFISCMPEFLKVDDSQIELRRDQNIEQKVYCYVPFEKKEEPVVQNQTDAGNQTVTANVTVSNATAQVSSSNSTAQVSSSNTTAQVSSSNTTAQVSSSNTTAQVSSSNTTAQPAVNQSSNAVVQNTTTAIDAKTTFKVLLERQILAFQDSATSQALKKAPVRIAENLITPPANNITQYWYNQHSSRHIHDTKVRFLTPGEANEEAAFDAVRDVFQKELPPIAPELEPSQFQHDLPAGAKVLTVLTYHYHYHFVEHEHKVSLIDLGEIPWFVETPWMKEKQTKEITIEIEIPVDPADAADGKIRVNVTIPAIQLLRANQVKTSAKPEPVQASTDKIPFGYPTDGVDKTTTFRRLDLNATVNTNRSLPDSNQTIRFYNYQWDDHTINKDYNVTEKFNTRMAYNFTVSDSPSFYINPDSALVNWNFHQHVFVHKHTVLISDDFIQKNESAKTAPRPHDYVSPGPDQDPNTKDTPNDLIKRHRDGANLILSYHKSDCRAEHLQEINGESEGPFKPEQVTSKSTECFNKEWYMYSPFNQVISDTTAHYHFHDERVVHNHTVAIREQRTPGVVFGFSNDLAANIVGIPNQSVTESWLTMLYKLVGLCAIVFAVYVYFEERLGKYVRKSRRVRYQAGADKLLAYKTL